MFIVLQFLTLIWKEALPATYPSHVQNFPSLSIQAQQGQAMCKPGTAALPLANPHCQQALISQETSGDTFSFWSHLVPIFFLPVQAGPACALLLQSAQLLGIEDSPLAVTSAPTRSLQDLSFQTTTAA